jgi:antimicrobial peptide system SdpA family protein
MFGFLIAATFYSLPSNVLCIRSPEDPVRLSFNILASENYAFFTRDPEATALTAFRRRCGALRNITATPQNKPGNLFGISRTQRAQGPELAGLANQHKVGWVACSAGISKARCLKSAFDHPAAVAEDTSPVPTACGDVVLADEVPVPWSYRNLIRRDHTITRTMHLHVRCRR